MDEHDPHIHVEKDVVRAGAAFRDVTARLLGRAPDAPSVVTTGCGCRRPYAMTSPRPEKVTCAPCREHAHRAYLRFAERIEELARMPGLPFTGAQAAEAAERLRELARRYGG
ncbi:hypothetical protein [Streptomyces sp. NPDC052496]|uniref:hypothetical protein n=1 Tax=Streptomyces sp. NPDC052496 TaxID=3154951 RepID=UPI003418D75F